MQKETSVRVGTFIATSGDSGNSSSERESYVPRYIRRVNDRMMCIEEIAIKKLIAS